MKVKISKRLQEGLTKVGLTAPTTSKEADATADLLDRILRRAQHLSEEESELLAMVCRELDKLAQKWANFEVREAEAKYASL